MKSKHPKQIENLLSYSPEQRFDFFIRYCTDFEQVWGLAVGEDNWVIFKDGEGDEVFPVWPHPDLAEKCCFEEHKEMGATPQSIGLKSFIENCIPDMVSNKVVFGIFFDLEKQAMVVGGDELKVALKNELATVWE